MPGDHIYKDGKYKLIVDEVHITSKYLQINYRGEDILYFKESKPIYESYTNTIKLEEANANYICYFDYFLSTTLDSNMIKRIIESRKIEKIKNILEKIKNLKIELENI